MHIKLAYYQFSRYRGADKKPVIGMKVCPCNRASSVGTIVNVSKAKTLGNSWHQSQEVEVLWETGKKRGKKSTHEAHNLVDFTSYLAAVKREYDELEALRQEASTFGM